MIKALTLALWAASFSLGAAALAQTDLSQDPKLARNIPLMRKSCYLKVAPIWDEGATGPVIQANQAYRDCLLSIAEKTLKQYYPSDSFKPLSPRKFLEKHLESVSTLAYTVQNSPKACLPHCGSMWQMVASGEEGQFLESLLREMAERILLEIDESLLTEKPVWKQCWDKPQSCPKQF